MIDELDLYLYEPEPFTSLNADPTVDKIDELEPENLDEALSNKQPETLGEDEAVLALRDWLNKFEEGNDCIDMSTVFTKIEDAKEDVVDHREKESTLYAWNDQFTDATLVRWFKSRAGDLERCKKALLRHMKWRTEHNVREIALDTVSKKLQTDFIVFGGPDTDHFPCVFVFTRDHDKDSVSHEETERLVIYLLEEALKQCDACRKKLGEEHKYTEQFTLVFDLWGFRLKNMNYDAIMSLVQIAKYNYPYILRRILIVNTPWIFKACYKIIQGFLPEDAKEIVDFTNSYEEISRYILPSNLPEQTIFAVKESCDVEQEDNSEDD